MATDIAHIRAAIAEKYFCQALFIGTNNLLGVDVGVGVGLGSAPHEATKPQ